MTKTIKKSTKFNIVGMRTPTVELTTVQGKKLEVKKDKKNVDLDSSFS